MLNDGYTWRIGSTFRGDANKFAAQLQGLKAPDGTIDVEEVLTAQRPEDAPLHEDIEWDDGIAAHYWRIDKVSGAMGALRVIPVNTKTEEREAPMRALMPSRVIDKENGQPRSYFLTVSSAPDDEVNINERVRQQAISDLRRLAQRIATLPGCQDIAEQLESILSTL